MKSDNLKMLCARVSEALKQPQHYADMKTALWIVFWVFVLTWGEPDLISSVVKFIDRL